LVTQNTRDIDELQPGLAGEGSERLGERLRRNVSSKRRGFEGLG
jgi:hypothetical protein